MGAGWVQWHSVLCEITSNASLGNCKVI